MTDLEWFRLLFAIAFGVWAVADVVFGIRYMRSLIQARFKSPFILATMVVATTCTLEVSAYGYAVWFQSTNAQFFRALLYCIPIVLILQAVAFVLIGSWVFSTRVEENPRVIT